jgi:hypothetical protein
MNGLRNIIETACAEAGGSLKSYTVLSPQTDPYRLDTPANHEVGKWFADQMARLNLLGRRLHLRGIHYALLGSTTMPQGQLYTNTGENWEWLQAPAAKAARWLGYVPFDAITDARNDEPIIRVRTNGKINTYLSVEPDITFPDLDDIEPQVGLTGFKGQQPYRLALYGEKSSLREILDPIAIRYDADLFLPTGEISDTQMYLMAKAGAQDGRKLIVFTLTDFDPAGWQMTISIGRKLQAFRDLLFPDLEFEVRPVGLTGAQAESLDLPSTPLKETELRADKWRQAMGREQTEIDALATLQPEVLTKIVRKAIAPFYDPSLEARVREVRNQWEDAAQDAVDKQLDHDQLARIRQAAEDQLGVMRTKLDELREMARTATADLDVTLPPIPKIPVANLDESVQGKPLLSSAWTWPDQTKALMARKSYDNGGKA